MAEEEEYLPLFVYGTLLEEEPLASTVERAVPARTSGQLADISEPFPAVVFQEGEGTVGGRLLWLSQASFAQTLAALDRYEDVPRLFRRVKVQAESDSGPILAYAYEWVGETWQAYCEAAEKKVAIAAYHQRRLEEALTESSHPTVVQAHFEGVLQATIAAADQLAEAISRRLALALDNANLQMAAEAMPTSTVRKALFKWIQRPIGADVRELRRRATHHYYWKTRGGPRPSVQRPVDAKPYGGPRDLVSYGQAVVAYAESLTQLIEKFRQLRPEALLG